MHTNCVVVVVDGGFFGVVVGGGLDLGIVVGGVVWEVLGVDRNVGALDAFDFGTVVVEDGIDVSKLNAFNLVMSS